MKELSFLKGSFFNLYGSIPIKMIGTAGTPRPDEQHYITHLHNKLALNSYPFARTSWGVFQYQHQLYHLYKRLVHHLISYLYFEKQKYK